MHFYWRIMEELKYLGEILVIHDPSLLREFNGWLRKYSSRLALFNGERKDPLGLKNG